MNLSTATIHQLWEEARSWGERRLLTFDQVIEKFARLIERELLKRIAK